MAITAQMVKELREMTAAGMMDCKKALVEADGDMKKAVDILREKGLSKVAKKAGRIAAEGLVRIASSEDGKKASIVEVNSETDFVSKNSEFQEFVESVSVIVRDNEPSDVETLKALQFLDAEEKVEEVLTQKISKIGENMSIRRFEVAKVESGAVVGYLHGAGNIASLVALESEASVESLQELGKDLAMQVAAMNPKYISRDDVEQDYIDHEREVLMQQALNEGKPEAIVQKMVEGRLNKELKEVCLLEQAFVKDGDLSVKQVIANTEKELGKSIQVAGIFRYEVGEGLEKRSEDFADEVAKQMGN